MNAQEDNSRFTIEDERENADSLYLADAEQPITDYSLDQNYPNPFNPATTIRFALPKPSHVTLTIYDVDGRLVTTLVDKQMPPGVHKAIFDASSLSSGVYFYRIETEGFVRSKKLILLK